MRRGFTLVELLVAITIFTIVTALVLVKYQSFNGGVVLTNLAYEIALTVREAQTYGINVRGQGGNFDLSYGIHFTPNTKSFSMFSDTHVSPPSSLCNVITLDCSGNGRYDSGDLSVGTFNLSRGITLQSVCGTGQSGELCVIPTDNVNQVGALDITFNRPDPSASFVFSNTSGGVITYPVSSVRIRIVAPNGISKRDVVIQSTGQIQIKDATGL